MIMCWGYESRTHDILLAVCKLHVSVVQSSGGGGGTAAAAAAEAGSEKSGDSCYIPGTEVVMEDEGAVGDASVHDVQHTGDGGGGG